jgi:hypothetical protein
MFSTDASVGHEHTHACTLSLLQKLQSEWSNSETQTHEDSMDIVLKVGPGEQMALCKETVSFLGCSHVTYCLESATAEHYRVVHIPVELVLSDLESGKPRKCFISLPFTSKTGHFGFLDNACKVCFSLGKGDVKCCWVLMPLPEGYFALRSEAYHKFLAVGGAYPHRLNLIDSPSNNDAAHFILHDAGSQDQYFLLSKQGHLLFDLVDEGTGDRQASPAAYASTKCPLDRLGDIDWGPYQHAIVELSS